MKRWWFAFISSSCLHAGCASINSGMPEDPSTLRPVGSAETPRTAPPRLIAGESRARRSPAAPLAPVTPTAEQTPTLASMGATTPTPVLASEAQPPPAPAPTVTRADQIEEQRAIGQPTIPMAPTEPHAEPIAESQPPRDAAAIPVSAAASNDTADLLDRLDSDVGQPAAEVAARVGDSIITLRELKNSVRDRMKPGMNWAELSRDQKNMVGRESLEYLIDRAMVIQEARRTLSKPKQWETFKEVVDKMWRDQELPDVMKRHGVQNEAALRQKLEQSGRSLAELHQNYLLDQMARIFTSERMRSKFAEPDLRELYGYYRENVGAFHQPAQTMWREIFVSVDENKTRDAARAKIDELRARLSAGADFAELAQAESESPRAKEGGLWQTSPGGFGSKAVNEALETLPEGAISDVLDDPKGYYLVRLESRRIAGPAAFEDVQGKIAEALRTRGYERHLQAYMKDIRSRTPVSSPLFDGGASEPSQSTATVVPTVQ